MYNIIIENENHITTLLTTLTLNIEMVNIIVLLIFLVIKKCLTKQLAFQEEEEEEEEEPLLIYTAQGSPFRRKKLSVINGSPEQQRTKTTLNI